MIEEKYKVAIRSCVEASKAIMRIYAKNFESFKKEDGSPLTKADLASTEIIHKYLDPLGIPITGEESKNSRYSERKKWKNCWCIDPLDGTKEFIKKNGEFAINIAFLENQSSVFGVIASPVEEKMIFGGKKIGVFECSFDDIENESNWNKIQTKKNIKNQLNIIGSRSHGTGPLDSLVNELKHHFDHINFISKGSSLKFFDLAKGNADLYPRFAPTMEWDIAAGQAIMEALGGEVINQENKQPLVYNKENLLNPFFVVKTKALLEAMA